MTEARAPHRSKCNGYAHLICYPIMARCELKPIFSYFSCCMYILMRQMILEFNDFICDYYYYPINLPHNWSWWTSSRQWADNWATFPYTMKNINRPPATQPTHHIYIYTIQCWMCEYLCASNGSSELSVNLLKTTHTTSAVINSTLLFCSHFAQWWHWLIHSPAIMYLLIYLRLDNYQFMYASICRHFIYRVY